VRREATKRILRSRLHAPSFTNSGARPSIVTRGVRWAPLTRKQLPPRIFAPRFTNSGVRPTITFGRAWAPVRRQRPRLYNTGLSFVPPTFFVEGILRARTGRGTLQVRDGMGRLTTRTGRGDLQTRDGVGILRGRDDEDTLRGR
jgi:hypothetical protein